MNDAELKHSGWRKLSPQSYRHHSGARVAKRDELWAVKAASGKSFGDHVTAFQAAAHLQENDPSFWTYGRFTSAGGYAGIFIIEGHLSENDKDKVFVCQLSGRSKIPKFFGKHLLNKAICAKCLRPITELQTRVLREFAFSKGRRNTYITCRCGYPVLRSEQPIDISRIAKADLDWFRQQNRRKSLEIAGGKRNRKEISQILAAQKRRCIYCNVRFTKKIPPTKDHILAVASGGADWGLNIVMACRHCNSHRNDIPFRTYCRTLSPTQNKRVLVHLNSRLHSLDVDSKRTRELVSFAEGLALHNPRHWRYRDLLRRSAAARRYSTQNKLLPGNILEKSLKAKIQELEKEIAVHQ